MFVAKELTIAEREQVKAFLHASFYNLDICTEVERHSSTKLYPERSGKQAHGACPFDDCIGDHDGFIVYPELSKHNNHYMCRNCKRTGNIVKFLQEIKGVKFAEACKLLDIPNPYMQLREQNGSAISPAATRQWVVTPEQQRRQQEREQREREEHEEQERLVKLYPRMQQQLSHERALTYLQERAIPLEIAQALGLGYMPPMEEMNVTNLALVPFLQKWADRLIFPLESRVGQGFTGRALRMWVPGMDELAHKAVLDEHRIPRYMTTAIPGYFNTKVLATATHIYLVEGLFDVCALVAAGIPDVVATCGTDIDVRFIPVRICDATLAYDGDQAGIMAAANWKRQFARKGIQTDRITPPDDGLGKDWSERWRRAGFDGLTLLFDRGGLPVLECQDCGATDEEYEYFYTDAGICYCETCRNPQTFLPWPVPTTPVPATIVPECGDQVPTGHHLSQDEIIERFKAGLPGWTVERLQPGETLEVLVARAKEDAEIRRNEREGRLTDEQVWKRIKRRASLPPTPPVDPKLTAHLRPPFVSVEAAQAMWLNRERMNAYEQTPR